MFPNIRKALNGLKDRVVRHRRWSPKTLVVGPSKPVDGDSVASTKALISHLRKLGLEAFTLPTPVMYTQIAWILSTDDYHPAGIKNGSLTSEDLQKAYDDVIAVWRPDEIVLVDGQVHLLGFDPRGVKVYTIDHHTHKGTFDNSEAFIQPGSSAGCLLIDHFGVFDPILAVSILTDTFWFRQNMPARAAKRLAVLTDHGLTDELLVDIQHRLMVRKDPHIVEALREGSIRISQSRRSVFAMLVDANPEIHRGAMGELGYFFDNICCIRGDGYVSFKIYNKSKELPVLAIKHGGGGHEEIAAGQIPVSSLSDAEFINRLEQEFLRVAGD